MRIKIKENSFIAKIAAWKLDAVAVAIVFGKTIHLHNASAEELINNHRWLGHELKHVEQFQKYGFLKFIFLYLMESIRTGYYRNKFEVEARKAEEETFPSFQIAHKGKMLVISAFV